MYYLISPPICTIQRWENRVSQRRVCVLFLAALFGIVLLSACAVNPVTGNRDFVLVSEDQEIAKGRTYHPKVIEHYGIVDNIELQNYVQDIGAKLAKVSHRNKLVYGFFVLDSKEVNAFALPGGYIYITRGLLAYLNNESELAAVLGHELGHITARHSVRQDSQSTAIGIIGAVVAAGTGVPVADDITEYLGQGIVRGYGRTHELEADRLGAEYLARAGYSPEAMSSVIRILKNQEIFETKRAQAEGRRARTYHGLFATHPDNDQRLQEVIQAAKTFSSKTAQVDRSEIFLDKLEGMTFGDGANDGILRWNNFYHKQLDFSISFPDNWRVDNSSTALQAQSADGNGLIRFMVLDVDSNISPQEFIKKRLQLGPFKREGNFPHQQFTGYTVVTPVESAFGKRLGRVIVLFHKRRAFVVVGVDKDTGQAARYDKLFIDTALNMHALTPEERPYAQAQRLHITSIAKPTTITELASKSVIPNFPDIQLRLLNGLYPYGEPQVGQRLKIVH